MGLPTLGKRILGNFYYTTTELHIETVKEQSDILDVAN